MKEEFTYKSTPGGTPPSGALRKGTFRDITLAGSDPALIDEYDSECMNRGITRKELFNELLGRPEDGGDSQRFVDVFSNVKTFSKVVDVVRRDISHQEIDGDSFEP